MPKEKVRCINCNKKVHLYGIKCKCDKIFCYSCLDIIKHGCTYNYKIENQYLLKKRETIQHIKVDKI